MYLDRQSSKERLVCLTNYTGVEPQKERLYMGGEFVVDAGYEGYVFLGWAKGQFESQNGNMMPYYNMYVLSPVSSFSSDNYQAFGMKAEKKKCLNDSVWADLKPGDRVKLFFDDKSRIVMVALDG